MFCILHISRSYPLDCYDYWSTSGANKQPRYILRQKKQNRYGGEKEGEGKKKLNEFEDKLPDICFCSQEDSCAAPQKLPEIGMQPKVDGEPSVSPLRF